MDVTERSNLTSDEAFGHWYYRAKFALLLDRIRQTGALGAGRRIADVGCGQGLFLTFLERTGCIKPEQLIGIDPAYTAAATAVGGRAQIEPQWPEDAEVDLALLMDVLEHTPDDRAVLGEAASHVMPGGHVFITVPAFNWLFSAHDRFLGHFRRYTLNSIRDTIHAVPGLEILKLHYFYASILPAVVPWRFACSKARPQSDLRKIPSWLNQVLTWITRTELRLAAYNRWAGVSVVALCRKTSTARSQPHPRGRWGESAPEFSQAVAVGAG